MHIISGQAARSNAEGSDGDGAAGGGGDMTADVMVDVVAEVDALEARLDEASTHH
jgi:hypothetical protein